MPKKTQQRVPYQIYIDESLKAKAIAKANSVGSNLAAFMVMELEEFLDRPIEKSVAKLKKHNNRRNKQL